MEKIKEMAKGLGISPGKQKKEALIRQIQTAEGNFPCFGTAIGGCDQQDCMWRRDCLG
ncbi:MAG: hypothetical protein JW874_04625 [Spirochaetales bacterium]|nr:hypothetical protein [Spirochaetales bacterium]